MTNRNAIRIAAAIGLLGVALGAFGAHGLKEVLTSNGTVSIWEKAVFCHLVHAVMLIVLAQRRPVPIGPWMSFLIGIVIFSGSLYLLALTNMHWLGTITPVGGVSFLVGWAWLLLSAGERELIRQVVEWWAQQDLNLRPSDYESPALTTELWPRLP